MFLLACALLAAVFLLILRYMRGGTGPCMICVTRDRGCVDLGSKSRALGTSEKHQLALQRWVHPEDARWKQREEGKQFKVIMLTYGTRGDVQPLIALALALEELGLSTALCAPACYQSYVEQFGIKYLYGGVDSFDQPQAAFESSNTKIAQVLDLFAEDMPSVANAMLKACEGYDFIVSAPLIRDIGKQIAEKYRIPAFGAYFAPSDTPTGAFPPYEYLSVQGSWFDHILPFLVPWRNKFLFHWRSVQIVRAAFSCGLVKFSETFRHDILKLPKIDLSTFLNDATQQPQLQGYSKWVQPRPTDWGSNIMVTGYWRLGSRFMDSVLGLQRGNSGRDMSKQLDAFIRKAKKAKKHIVFITFGSMQNVDDLISMVTKASLELGFYVIIGDTRHVQSKSLISSSKVFVCKQVINHAIIFPLCACIVHHGGAGTTCSAFYAGLPSIVIPILVWADQVYWGTRVTSVGCGSMISRSECTHDLLKSTLLRTTTVTMLANAKLMRKKLRDEPCGALVSAKIIRQYLDSLVIH
uniref:Glycosyltransferase family 28 N-terminal domain-containing protein n=1 Tax=Mucochytrium quahogii TaxID=96639 RepID=A0A7S2RSV1_9STRA|mmetsp:Transcript_17511/g.28343  ORF Transcript_17511/g.28343 Transcript_17511/m.28343 type:complete len:524 (+) Transcript_17511:76-1647(+)